MKSSSLPGIVGDLPINRSLPAHGYIQRLIEHFRESSSPESMRRVVFSSDKTLCEYASASFHLPGAYVKFFPCPHCTYNDEEERTSFVEVFHFANVHNLDVCATVKFIMPANILRLDEPTECSVEVEVTKGCPRTRIAVDHSPRVELHINTDVFIEVLRFLSRGELEKMLLVSRRWSSVIGGSTGSLQQRHSFSMQIKFYGERMGMLSVHVIHSPHSGPSRILRVLVTRGLSQALSVIRSHMLNAFVEGVFPFFQNRVPPPRPPREMLIDISLSARIDFLKSWLRSMPPNSEIDAWGVADNVAGFDNLPAIASCALEPHRKLGCVQRLELHLRNRDATWAKLASLLSQPSIRAFSELTVSTRRVAIDSSGLRTILSSRQLLKLHVFVSRCADPEDAILTLPAQIIQDFVTLRDVNSFVAEFSLYLKKPDNVALAEMPDVDEATDRRKRFRYDLQDEDTVIRVSVYENRTTRGYLTVVTFDHFRRTVVFFNGNMSIAKLKQVLQHRPYGLY
ncbi:hypothetical protein AAVH_33524 [Aphelenchoides avenae]|nr:hypothetical protein AAVH_33524 [Aphelenchus avenae]